MKKTLTILLLCLLLCGCAQSPEVPGVTDTPNATQSQSVGSTASIEPTGQATATESVTDAPTEETTLPGQTELPNTAPPQTVTPGAVTPGKTASVTASPTVPAPTTTARPVQSATATPAPTPRPTVSQKVVMLQDFEQGSASECIYSVDFPAAGFYIPNPVLSIANNGYKSSKGYNVKLESSGSTAQNFILQGDKVTAAFAQVQKYFRLWIKNETGGSLSVGVAIKTQDRAACFGVTKAQLTDKSGETWIFNTSDASDMGQGTHSAVVVPAGFEGWVAFDTGELIAYWSDTLINDISKVNHVCIDVRPAGFTENKSYIIDDVCLSSHSSGKIKESEPTVPDVEGEVEGPVKGSVDIYAGDSVDLLIGVDQFNRTFDVQVGQKNKQVGMFFWLWTGQHRVFGQQNGNYDSSKILEQYGVNTLLKQSSAVSPEGQFHFWGEPLWGYYDQSDEWVIRRQMELLTNAGVDFIVFDTTNGFSYYNTYMKICKVINQMITDGANPPRVAFYTHSLSIQVINEVYNDFYKKNRYPDTWYYYNGKPLIIGYTNVADDKKEAQSRGDYSYNPSPLSQEILNFFTFRRPQWPSDSYNADGFPWIEWKYPQPMYNGRIMNVSVASHPAVPMSFSLTRGAKNWGRGYNVATGQNQSDYSYQGQFFQSQWDNAISQNADLVFVDGWNEWIALKSSYMGEYQLCDAVNLEYSRDIEIMKGGYNDAFYIQLIKNIRRFKGNSLNGVVASTQKTIDINGGIEQWANVNSVYNGTTIRSVARNYHSAGDVNLIYKQDAARNNITKVSITRDKDNFYFLIECSADIKGSGENYMNLFIGTGDLSINKGWNGYQYVINRKISGSNSDIIKLNSSFGGTKCGTAKVNVSGKYMQIAVPRSAIGMSNSTNFYFKVADNVTNPSDIMDYYVSGKSFPLGRMSYRYLG